MIANAESDGSVAVQIEEVPPGGQSTFNVTVSPKLYGIYESTRARIKYNAATALDDSQDFVRTGLSSSLGRTRIISSVDFLRSTSYFVKEWTIFTSSAAFAVFYPLYTWLNLRRSHANKRKHV